VRRLNPRLLLSAQEAADYETLPLAAVEKSGGADPTPQLHLPYISPLLSCDAWAPLQTGILQRVYDLVGRKIELLAEQVASLGISLESTAPGDALLLTQLRVLNEIYTGLHVVAFTDGVHPLAAFHELCRAIGQLAIFGVRQRPPQLPRYDHDNLGPCFYQLKREIDTLVEGVREPEYEQVAFEGVGKRMQVTLQQRWLLAQWQMFAGVKSPLPDDECVDLLTKGQLDMKIGSADKVERIFQMGLPGLKMAHCPQPPRGLPNQPGLIYFQVSRNSEEWASAQQSLTLAIRINENRIAGDVQGNRTLTVRRANGQTTTMEFALYLAKAPGASRVVFRHFTPHRSPRREEGSWHPRKFSTSPPWPRRSTTAAAPAATSGSTPRRSRCTTPSRTPARRRAAERQRMADAEDAGDTPDWRPVLRLCLKALSEQSKDLEIAAYVIEALVRLHGFAGLRDGFRLARALVERFWDELHPLPDEDGLETRLAPLTGLNGADAEGTLIARLARVPLTEGGTAGPLAYHHYQQALALARIEDAAKREARVKDSAVSLEMIERAAAETPARSFTDLLDDLDASLEEFARLNDVLKDRCGAHAPPASNIRSALEACRDAVRHIGRAKLSVAGTEARAEEDGGAAVGSEDQPAAVAGAARSREDAFRTLLQVADYFRRGGPHSLVSYAPENAVRWGRMTLPELMAELLSADAPRQEYFKQVGIRAPGPANN
jgi:type VI secretion system ImpA family protein